MALQEDTLEQFHEDVHDVSYPMVMHFWIIMQN